MNSSGIDGCCYKDYDCRTSTSNARRSTKLDRVFHYYYAHDHVLQQFRDDCYYQRKG